jgi:hypothetical protein
VPRHPSFLLKIKIKQPYSTSLPLPPFLSLCWHTVGRLRVKKHNNRAPSPTNGFTNPKFKLLHFFATIIFYEEKKA